MKQHITIEQLYELNNGEYLKLCRLIDPKGPCGQMCITDEMRARNITIGKMIEILETYCKENKVNFDFNRGHNGNYIISGFKISNSDCVFYANNNLCDALFKAVKEVLEG